MKKQLQKLRRFFVRTKNYNASLARPVSHSACDDDDDGNRLSGAFIVVLLLHIVAVVGVFAFARITESRDSALPPKGPTQTPAGKTPGPKAAPPAVAQEFMVRQGSLEQLRTTPSGRVFLAEALAVDISATQIRAALQRGEQASSLISPVVLDYIQQHNLYKI